MCSSTVSALTILNTQHAYARGKAIGSVIIIVIVIVVDTKIIKYGDLGT